MVDYGFYGISQGGFDVNAAQRATFDAQFGARLAGIDPALYEKAFDAYKTMITSPMGSNTNTMAASYISQLALWHAQGGSAASRGSGSSGPSKAQIAASIEAEIRDIAGVLGIPARDWNSLAWEAANNNWNAAMIRDRLAEMLDISMVNTQGIVQQTKAKATEMARQYYVNVTDQEALDWAKRIASEELDESQMAVSIRDRAKAQYYWLSEAIDSGVTLEQYFQSHKALVAQLMETNAESIDFMNNEKYNKILNYQDPETKTTRSMNLFETAKYIRSMDDWKRTSNAAATASDAAVAISRVMGAI